MREFQGTPEELRKGPEELRGSFGRATEAPEEFRGSSRCVAPVEVGYYIQQLNGDAETQARAPGATTDISDAADKEDAAAAEVQPSQRTYVF